jgi:sortase A
MDRVLLGIEIVCALIVAWIAVQYVYTVYFDTGPHRVTPSALPGSHATATRTAMATPTRFAELLPPETGGPGDAGTGTQYGLPSPTPAPTATATVEPELLLPSRLRIPVMFLDSPVHEVTVNMGQWEVSPMDIGHHEGTANPGEIGNVVLAGHRDINSALFRELDRLKPGDDVFVSNSLGEYHYIVRESMVVGPDHTEVMDSTPDRRLTLITCTPIGIDTQRLIVIATLDDGQ